ncbi:MAG: hypothetical protein LAO78_21395 [Acidobacteriia bacterium]|nr:hypothetical protein [Terriglobia bacterium]
MKCRCTHAGWASGKVLTIPLFFASNAIYPIAIMRGWVRAIARIDPLG